LEEEEEENKKKHEVEEKNYLFSSGLLYLASHDAMVAEYVFSNAHNYSLTPKFAIFFALPISQHKRLVWHPEFLPLGK
jgi:hypothetical protein